MNRKPSVRIQKKKKQKALIRKVPEYDYLKYYRLVRYWAKKKYDLNDQDLEILFFIYSEDLFTKTRFLEYCKIFSWNKDRFSNLKKYNWIRSWRAAENGRHALYEASFKTRRLVTSIYKKLDGEEPFSERPDQNPIFKRETYTDRRMAGEMVRVNKEMKKRRDLTIKGVNRNH